MRLLLLALLPIAVVGGASLHRLMRLDQDMKKSTGATETPEFEPEFIAGLTKIFEQLIPFNRVLGLKITSVKADGVIGRIDMRPELVGHYVAKNLHGGVISAGLDAMGGIAVMAASGARHMNEPPAQRLHRFGKLGTIDLRIDYLRPAAGDYFELRANVLRLGSRVATVRMELLGSDGTLRASGAAAYIVS